MKHLGRGLVAALAVIVPALTTFVASPAVQHFVSAHPATAVYIPVVTALLAAVALAVRDQQTVGEKP